MNLSKKQIILIAIAVVIIGAVAALAATIFLGPNITTGEKNVLVLAVDPSEKREGMGAVDMAFIVKMENGNVKKTTPFYPGGKKHPTEPEPSAAGVGGNLLMHDSLWYADNSKGMRLAKEIVEHNTGEKIDAVVAANTAAVDGIINASKPITIKGQSVEISAIDLVREEQNSGGMSRGDAVKALSSALLQAAQDPAKKDKVTQVIIDQYNAGNILVEPSSAFLGFIIGKIV
ncbi:MAG: DUF4012 domain-containing protein [Methanobacteriaceae archaeon]